MVPCAFAASAMHARAAPVARPDCALIPASLVGHGAVDSGVVEPLNAVVHPAERALSSALSTCPLDHTGRRASCSAACPVGVGHRICFAGRRDEPPLQ